MFRSCPLISFYRIVTINIYLLCYVQLEYYSIDALLYGLEERVVGAKLFVKLLQWRCKAEGRQRGKQSAMECETD